MALDRQGIERKDFPVGRRGYDPEAVDAHLSAIAEEIDEFKRSARRRSETLASSASEQVRAIVEAAETSAADIQKQAEEEAGEIRAEANTEAQNTREQSVEQAREYVGKVSESTSSMLQRLNAMENELAALIESLRTGANRLNADLQLLEGNLSEVGDAVSPRPVFEPEQFAEPEPAEVLAAEEVDVELEEATYDYVEPVAEVSEPLAEPEEPLEEPVTADAGLAALVDVPGDGTDDTEGARLIALNMALNGTPREETDRYLAENFQLSDRDGLLNEVYASVEG